MERKALYFTAPQRLSLETEALPPPAFGQVLVQTLISAISPGTELLIYRGQAPEDVVKDETIAALAGNFTFPLKYGYAVVGRVIELGRGVAPDWQDRLIFAFHPHESHFLATPDELLMLPADLGPEDAVFFPNMETAVTFLLDGQPLMGEQVAIFGQGIVGLLLTALLSRWPLASLVTLDLYPRRRPDLRNFRQSPGPGPGHCGHGFQRPGGHRLLVRAQEDRTGPGRPLPPQPGAAHQQPGEQPAPPAFRALEPVPPLSGNLADAPGNETGPVHHPPVSPGPGGPGLRTHRPEPRRRRPGDPDVLSFEFPVSSFQFSVFWYRSPRY